LNKRGGIIYSADAFLEAKGDYNTIFATMKETKNYGPLFGAHMACNRGAKKSMKEGISPVIIDNTNIKKADMKTYVKAALTLGFSDDNIQFVDVGDGGLTADELFNRNVHGVPLDKIESMIASYRGQGTITVETVMAVKDKRTVNDVLYSCVLLGEESKKLLLKNIGDIIPKGWEILGHHMTISLAPLKDKKIIGDEELLLVTHIGISDMAIAVKVISKIKTKNPIPHITVAINKDGGKPVMSNDITEWKKVAGFILLGIVTEIKISSTPDLQPPPITNGDSKILQQPTSERRVINL
jgi:hypothetical protein